MSSNLPNSSNSTFIQLATHQKSDDMLTRYPSDKMEPSMFQQSAMLEWKATTIVNMKDEFINFSPTIEGNIFFQPLSQGLDLIDNLILQTSYLERVKSVSLMCGNDKFVLTNNYHSENSFVIETLDRQALSISEYMLKDLIKDSDTLILPFFLYTNKAHLIMAGLPYCRIYVKVEFEISVPSDTKILVQSTNVSGVVRSKLGKIQPHEIFIDTFMPLYTVDVSDNELHKIVIGRHVSMKHLFISVYDIEEERYTYEPVNDLMFTASDMCIYKDNKNSSARIIEPLLHGLIPYEHFMFSFNSDRSLFSNYNHYISHGHFNTAAFEQDLPTIKIKLNNPQNKKYQISLCAIAIRCLTYTKGSLEISM
jgi:hypothetical protein